MSSVLASPGTPIEEHVAAERIAADEIVDDVVLADDAAADPRGRAHCARRARVIEELDVAVSRRLWWGPGSGRSTRGNLAPEALCKGHPGGTKRWAVL